LKGDKLCGLVGVIWGIAGISLLLLNAIFRLGNIAWELFNYSLLWHHWLLLGGTLWFMAYSEGYKGFQLKFAPRFAARCMHLQQRPNILHTLLAPFFCMGFFHTTKKRKIATYTITLLIIGFILVAHRLSQPWRGILDAGVVLGLTWGLIAIYYCLYQAFYGEGLDYSAELPDEKH